jgi:hypothetical protein
MNKSSSPEGWRPIIDGQASSGLTVATYYPERGISAYGARWRAPDLAVVSVGQEGGPHVRRRQPESHAEDLLAIGASADCLMIA